MTSITPLNTHFNPRSPWGERPWKQYCESVGLVFQSTLPVGGATGVVAICNQIGQISIHAPRGGSDLPQGHQARTNRNFNPRSPWGERPPACCSGCAGTHFNPRSPWGERPDTAPASLHARNFNPRSPWGERQIHGDCTRKTLRFQSTLPVGGATKHDRQCRIQFRISIHAPRGGSDEKLTPSLKLIKYFNPRSPWGERQNHKMWYNPLKGFQSTLPVGGATMGEIDKMFIGIFQSTLPVGGATVLLNLSAQLTQFQSTLPVGGATRYSWQADFAELISIHAPRGGSDIPVAPGLPHRSYFNPRSPWGERLL